MNEDAPLGIALRTPPRRDPWPEGPDEPLVRRLPTDTPEQARMAAEIEQATLRAQMAWLRGGRVP